MFLGVFFGRNLWFSCHVSVANPGVTISTRTFTYLLSYPQDRPAVFDSPSFEKRTPRPVSNMRRH
jgi:hypothetical protein